MREVHSPLLKRLVAGGNLLGRRGEGGGGGGGGSHTKRKEVPIIFSYLYGVKKWLWSLLCSAWKSSQYSGSFF